MIVSQHDFSVLFGFSVVSVFLKFNHALAAECQLEKIFRTPKDLSKVNFDHFELVERNGFDQLEPTIATTTEAPFSATTPKRNGPNVANAQVLLRFGGDDIHGSNHIMKIPPPNRGSLFGQNFMPHFDAYYPVLPPPPPHRYSHMLHPQYYHPYPPPVPYVFPNYYFCNYGAEPQYLPPQLKEYFKNHQEVVGKQYPTFHEDADFVHNQPIKTESKREVPEQSLQEKQLDNPLISNPEKKSETPVMRPRILQLVDLSNEDIETLIKKKKTHSKKKSPKKEASSENDCKKQNKTVTNCEDDLKTLLNKALVAYSCKTCSDKPKMLITYPITNRKEDVKPILSTSNCSYCAASKKSKFANDVDGLHLFNTAQTKESCKCSNCQCKKTNELPEKFTKDLDDLIGLVVAEIIDTKPEPSVLPCVGGASSKLPRLSVDLAASSPWKCLLDLDLASHYPTNLGSQDLVIRPATKWVTSEEENCGVSQAKLHSYPIGAPSYYFIPEPNVSIRKRSDPLPKYLKVVPRGDLETVTPPKVKRNFCKNCGNFHQNYEAPIVILASSYCPTCPKETRQLNDW